MANLVIRVFEGKREPWKGSARSVVCGAWQMPMFLVPISGGTESDEPIPLDKAILFVGRHPDCDVVLNNSRKVSRKHCCVAQINNSIVVRDLGSMNGTRIRDEMARDEIVLKIGDELWVGDVGFRMEFRNAPGKVGSKAPAQPLRSAKLDRGFVSQDFPVAIPEQDADVVVEVTGVRRPLKSEEILRIQGDDETEGPSSG